MSQWFSRLLNGPGGSPDEAALAFVLAQFAAIVGAFIDVYFQHKFPFGEFGTFETVFLPLYRVAVAYQAFKTPKE